MVSQLGVTQAPPVEAVEAYESVDGSPFGQPIVPFAVPAVPSTRHEMKKSES